jgi:1,4-dihydroxy-2-naphthoyl-CoA synthase
MSLRAWLDERTPLASLEEAIAHKTAEHREAVTAFIEKRAPDFERVRAAR